MTVTSLPVTSELRAHSLALDINSFTGREEERVEGKETVQMTYMQIKFNIPSLLFYLYIYISKLIYLIKNPGFNFSLFHRAF